MTGASTTGRAGVAIGSDLTPIDDALAELLSSLPTLESYETLPLGQVNGRVLATDIIAPLAVPSLANSAMDGYALRAEDSLNADKSLPVSQRIAAGEIGSALMPASAARIFTGAPLPPGADAVVMQENCQAGEGVVTVLQAVVAGENVRPAGADIECGSLVFAAGRRLRPQDIGALASLGLTELPVRCRLKVALMTTGDELQRPGEPLRRGQIYDSNFATLVGLLEGLGAEVIDCGRVGDTLAATQTALAEAATRADCVITTGGVSVGEEDHVRHAVAAVGRIALWKLAVKPGKPFAYGVIPAQDRECQFFGLPGNPVSAFVTFALIVRPCLLAMLGVTAHAPQTFPVSSGFARGKGGPRQEYLRAVLETTSTGLQATPLANQSSGVAASLSRSDGLLVVPPYKAIAQGDSLQFIPFSELGC